MRSTFYPEVHLTKKTFGRKQHPALKTIRVNNHHPNETD